MAEPAGRAGPAAGAGPRDLPAPADGPPAAPLAAPADGPPAAPLAAPAEGPPAAPSPADADLPSALAGRLHAAGLEPGAVASLIVAALAEDLAGGADVTTRAIIEAGTRGRADVTARSAGVLAGLPVAEAVFVLAGRALNASQPVRLMAGAADGDRIAAGQALLTVEGPLEVILTAERTALNLLCHLSGIATLTRQWVGAVAGTAARVRDTRKTLPGLRQLEKYAVRCGGGINHRMSLSDAALIKDNHVAAAGSVAAALAAVAEYAASRGNAVQADEAAHGGDAPLAAGAKAGRARLPVEVECDTVVQVAEALAAGAGLILLDNFTVAQLGEAVALTAGRALLEASGGLSLDSAGDVAGTGVDFLAVGALTHSAPALDIGLDLVRAGSAGREGHAADD